MNFVEGEECDECGRRIMEREYEDKENTYVCAYSAAHEVNQDE